MLMKDQKGTIKISQINMYHLLNSQLLELLTINKH